MGREVAFALEGSYWFMLPLTGGLLIMFIGMYYLMDAVYGFPKKALVLLLIGIVLATYGTIYVDSNYDEPFRAASQEKALSPLWPLQRAYTTQKFYLKESVSEPGLQSKLQGNISGFLFVSGSVYGSIDSKRVMTVIYKDDDSVIDPQVGVYRSISYSLDEVAIVTIEAPERPYLMYPEAKVVKVARQPKLTPGIPYLYLPEGWKVL